VSPERIASIALLLASMLAEPALAASFPCEKAATRIEKLICAQPRLSSLDEHLGRYYAAARPQLGSAASCLVKNQRAWLRTVRSACADAACLERAYLARLAELDPLQPGVTALRSEALPPVKALVWIVPPAEDEVAAPRVAGRPPLVVAGRLRDEVTDGDGYVLEDASGAKHVLLALMFIDKASGVALETLAGEPGARFEARGEREASSDGTAHFAPSACTFVYRLPK
jgi:uncharacterized protein